MSAWVIKVSKEKTDWIKGVGVVLFLLFGYSRLSWGYLLPSIAWGGVLCISIALLIISDILRIRHLIHIDITEILCGLMVLIIVFNNNYDIANGKFLSIVFPYLCMFFVYIACSKSDGWIRYAVTVMLLVGAFFVLMTLYCGINQSFYYDYVHPIMLKYGTTYTAHPSAGFTAHYSTNGIYLAMSLCAILGLSLFSSGWDKKTVFFKLIYILANFVALLICNKRGIIICLAFSIVVSYFVYDKEKRFRRVFNIIGIGLAIVTIVYVLSLFVPSVERLIDRFISLGSDDSNTNQRLLLWEYALQMLKSKPLFGNGWRCFMYTNPIFPGADAHNVYLQLLAENGFLGASVFFAFFAVNFFRTVKVANYVRINKYTFSREQQSYIFIAFLNETFMLPFMFEGTALYMPECMSTYFVSCAISQYYYQKIKRVVNNE